MTRRNRRGRFTKVRQPSRWEQIICFGMLGGILLGITIDFFSAPSERYVYAKEEPVVVPQEVRIRVHIEWTKERIEQEIRNTFTEDPETAIKIAHCESSLVLDVQSYHVLNGEREQSHGIFQIHSPSWHKKAVELGYENYKTDPADNIAMARYIYDNAGKRWRDWSCYTKKMI